MEDLLQTIIKEASGKQFQNLKQAAQIAYDKLFRQHVNRDPPSELRSVCFIALKMALDSKRTNLISLGLNGMHKLIRDERFFIGLEPEDDSNWLPAQLLRSTNGISCTGNSNEETVVNVLRLFLSMACAPTCTLNGRLLIEVLSRCGEFWEYGTRSIKAASLASASQCLRTFCSFLKDEADELKQTTHSGNMMATVTIYNEVIPVMQWLCSKLIEPSNGTPKKQHSSLFLMECILTLTSSLPHDVHSSPHFTAFLWKTFCPSLAASLGFPGRVNIDKKFSYKDAMHIIESENRGFFTRPGLDGPDARCVYQTAIQLLRIAGAQGSLRPVLEALFHRMLLLPSPQNRSEPLRCVRDAFKNPQRIIDLSVILHYDKNQSVSDDMELFRLIIDSMEEVAASANSTFGSDESLHSSIECLVALLSSLQTMCNGNVENMLSDEVAEVINSRFSTMKEADYYGPLTYQSLIRLPRDYRDAVAELKQSRFETGSDSETDDINVDHHHEPDVISNDSGETEGPEDECSSDEQAAAEANWLYTQLNDAKLDGEGDRKHAKEFAKIVKSQLVPSLLKLHSSIEIDAEIQEFSSNICQKNSMNFSDFDYNLTIINADGIYLAVYSTFLLSLQLTRIGHYDKTNGQIAIPLTEQQFVNSVQSAGVLVYLSSAWLRELYQCILASNPLEALNNIENTTSRCTLIDMICDIGGIGSSQMMSEWQRLQTVSKYMNPIEAETMKQKAAKKLARRLLTCCWDSMVVILSAGLGEVEDSRAKKIMKFSKKHLKVGGNNNRRRQTGEAALYALSLEGLHAAATLSNSLQLQHLAGKILSMIATNVCLSSGPKLPSSQALSMELVLTGGLELGSCSDECWLPVFSVCRHVTQLEHDLFSSNSSGVSGTGVNNGAKGSNCDDSSPSKDKHNPSNYFIDEDETCVDVYSFLQAPMQNPNTSIATILKSYPNTVSLTQSDTAKVLCALSHLADSLFSDAAERLNMPSLCHFLKSLCRASREQLYRNTTSKKGKKSWWLGRPWKVKNQSLPLSLLLHRVGEITLKIFRSSRPLLHILKVWSISGPHLMEAACHKDRDISKRAVEYIHDVITALLVEQSELPHFHFNEALLKPFENILSMQNCDTDVQDQIITCCMMIVEAHRSEIRSGWRPLFGTLTSKKMSISSVIIDIFRIFLETENTLVFANAGLDCILCLLSYLETSTNANGGSVSDDENLNNNNINNNSTNNLGNGSEFLHDVLKFLERCSTILGCLFNMSNTPNIHSTYKIKGISYTHIVDANTQNSLENFQYFGNEHLQNLNEQLMISYRSLHIDRDSITKLEDLEKNGCGVLKVWFLLLDGLTNALILCPLPHQSPIIQSVFKIFRSIFDNPGIDFGFYCVNHLLIPMNQDWLRYINKTQKSWAVVEKNYKHCCCMTTDLVVEFIEKSQPKKVSDDEEASKISTAANLALKQLLIVLIECSVQPQESVSRIGVSCLKHIIFSIGYLFNEEQWLSVVSAIHRAGTINLAPLRQLSFAFHENSNSFYGDIATLKVAARRDCTLEEINRIYSLSQQVFQLDSQKDSSNSNNKASSSEIKIINEDRSYAFLLYPNSSTVDGNFVLRIPYRSLVVGLLVSQMFLQLIANILLNGLKCVAETELHSVIYEYNSTSGNGSGGNGGGGMTSTTTGCDGNGKVEKDKKTQFNLSYRAREILYRCLRQYLNSSIEFDYRPGLKFLIQKVANLDYAANLYKQLTSSFIIVFMSLVDSYLSDISRLNLSQNDLRFIIESSNGDNLIKKKEFFVRNLFVLREIWDQVSDLYLKAVKIVPSPLHHHHNRLSFATEINIVENKMVEIQDQLRNYDTEDDDDDVFLPPSIEKSLEKTPSEESVKIFMKDYDANENNNISSPEQQKSSSPRENPFNNQQQQQSSPSSSSSTVSPEIEQQRKMSIMRDDQSKCKSLTQLVVASMELLKLLPNKSTENIRLFLTPKINDAFNMIERFETNNAENIK